MMRFSLILPFAICLDISGQVAADTLDSTELAFWQSISHSQNPAEYLAYLDAYPNGRFAGLAQLRLGGTAIAPKAPPVEQVAPDMLIVRTPAVRHIDGIVVDVDARSLSHSSNLRIAVVPEKSLDAVSDSQAFVQDSTPIDAKRVRLTLPNGPAGADEVRLYQIRQFDSTFTVASRASVVVGPAMPNTALARDVTREALALGPVKFEAEFKDRDIAVEGQFIDVQPAGNFDLDWAALLFRGVTQTSVLLRVGTIGVTSDGNGSVDVVLCVIDASDQTVLQEVAALSRREAVVVVGHPTVWSSWSTADPVLLESCQIGK
jgi:hypothetical protein